MTVTPGNLKQSALRRVAIVQHQSVDPGDAYCRRVEGFLAAHGIQTETLSVPNKDAKLALPDPNALPDLGVVLGGDGTFLRAARLFTPHKVPLVGLNMGKLGFLTRIELKDLDAALERLVNGQYRVEKRLVLTLEDTGAVAINDILIKCANPWQMATVKLFVNDRLVAVYDADGIVIATPTGSTAYSLSAGGAVISPEVEAISITPICPHSLSAKPVVIPSDKHLRVEAAAENRHPVCYAVDGQELGTIPVEGPGRGGLQIRRADVALHMVDFEDEDQDFYGLLRTKLHWAMNPRGRG